MLLSHAGVVYPSILSGISVSGSELKWDERDAESAHHDS